MKRLNRCVAILLAIALVLPGVMVPTVASAEESNWIPSDGTTILSETSETWIVDTVTVEFGMGSPYTSYVQHTEKLTELVGRNGRDGRSYVHVSVEDGTTSTAWRTYVHMQLVGSSDTSSVIDGAPSEKAMTWYLYNDGSTFLLGTNHATANRGYGTFADVATRGIKLTFTEQDGYVVPRAIDNGAYQAASNYLDEYTQNVKSDYMLNQIQGDNGETGEDGVYLRFHTQCGSIKLKCTFTVAYPKPESFDYTASHWVVKNGAKILSESTETWKLDTVNVNMDNGERGYVQHKQKMTELIGNNNTDGRGWVNVVMEDGTWAKTTSLGYQVVQLVGDRDASGKIDLASTTEGMSWYLRPNGDTMMLMRGGDSSNPSYHDDTIDKEILAASGFRLAFTQDDSGYVTPRGCGIGVSSNYFGYGAARINGLQSAQTLAQLPRDNEADTDGVYVRIQTKGSTSRLNCTASVFYPASDIESVQPQISDSISLYWTAMVADTAATPVMKFKMDGKEEVTVAGTKSTKSRWVFAYTDILPQDLGKNIQASLYDGEGAEATLLSTCVYSMETYCRNQMINNSANLENTALWTLLLNLLDYGAEAQTYFGDEGTLVNSSVREAFQCAYNTTAPTLTDINAKLATLDATRKATMSGASAVPTLVAGERADGYTWQSATLSLQDYVKVRFKFTAPVDENFKVVIGTQEYTLANGGIVKAGSSYYVYTDGISISDFDQEITAKFYRGDAQIGQTVTYSVNTYINWMSGQSADTADAYNLVQALYSYSTAAVAYNA